MSAVQRTERLDWIVPTTATAFALDTDGRRLLAGHADGTVSSWDVDRKRQLGASLRVADGAISKLAFALDGRTFAAAGAPGTRVSLWDVRQRRRLGVLGKGAVEDLAFSPDGRTIAVASDSGTALWDVRGRVPARRLDRAGAGGVAFSPDGTIVATTEHVNRSVLSALRVRLRDVATGRRLGKDLPYAGDGNQPSSVAFSPDGRVLAAATLGDDVGNPGLVRVWDLARRRPFGTGVNAAAGGVRDLAFTADGMLVSSADGVDVWRVDRRARFLDKRTGELFRAYAGETSDLAVGPNGLLAALGADGTIRVANTAQAWTLGSPLEGAVGEAVALAADADLVAAASSDGTIALWDLERRQRRGAPLSAPTSYSAAVALAADGKTLAFGNSDGRVTLRNVEGSRKPRAHFQVGGFVAALGFAPGAETLASIDDGGRVALMRTAGRPRVRRLPGAGFSSLAFSPTGGSVALGRDDGTVVFRDGAGRRRLDPPIAAHRGGVSSVAFSRDGRRLASAGEADGTVRLWDVATRRPLGPPLKVSELGLSSVGFSPDGRTLAVGSKDLRFALWDVEHRRPIGSPLAIADVTEVAQRAPNPLVDTLVAFGGNGRTLMSVGGERLVLWRPILWSRSATAFRDRLCGVVGRNLTPTEWEGFLPGAAYHKTCPQWPAPER